MINKIIIEGPPGSGKSSLVDGKSHNNDTKGLNSLRGMGYNIAKESISYVYNQMRLDGKLPKDNKELAIKKILQQEYENYSLLSNDKIYFIDRGPVGYLLNANRYNVKVDEQFYDFCSSLKDTSIVFLFKPIDSLDFTDINISVEEERKYTLDQRNDIYVQMKKLYSKMGYTLVEVPTFSDNKKSSIDLRISFILDTLKDFGLDIKMFNL